MVRFGLKRWLGFVGALVALLVVVVTVGWAGSGSAQTDDPTPDGTVAALGTSVAVLQTQVADLQTQVAGGEAAGSTATPTAAVGETPAAAEGTPVASANGVELAYVYTQPAPYGAAIYGALRNTTDRPATAPQITVTFTDDQGATLDSVQVYTAFTVIPAGEEMGFEGSTTKTDGAIGEVSVSLSGGGPADAEPGVPGVEIRNLNEVSKTETNLTVLGEVYNGADVAISGVVRVMLYRVDGRFAGTEYRLGNFGDIAPGQSGSFRIDTPVDAGTGWTYEVLPDVYPLSRMPAEADRGIVEVVGASYDGTPEAVRTGASLLYLYAQPSAFGGSRLYGEAENTTEETIDSPALYFTFYDEQDRIIDSTKIFPLIGIIPAGETAPYDGSSNLAPEEWARFTVTIGESEPADISTILAYPEGLEIGEVTETDRIATGVRLVGEVANNGDAAVSSVNVLALFYRADGRYAGSQWVSTDPEDLAPGERGAFELVASVDAGEGWTYRLIARGTPERT